MPAPRFNPRLLLTAPPRYRFCWSLGNSYPKRSTTMTPKDHPKLTREELYNLVWAKPMTEVGHDFGISDRAMAKVCAKKQVPVPTRGYWAKKTAGKGDAKLPLPEFVVKAPKESKGGVTPARQTAEKRSFGSMFEQRNQTIKKALREFRKPLSEAIGYTVRIEEWRCDYSFGINASYNPLHRDNAVSFLHEAPYSEYRDLFLIGVFLKPAPLRQKRFEARLARQAHLDEKTIGGHLHRYEESPPKSIGGFLKQNGSIVAYLSIPEDAFALVLQNAAAHKIKFMTLRGQKLRYGRGDVYGYSLQEQQDE